MSNEIVTEIRLELDKFRADLADAQKHGEESAHAIGEKVGEKLEEGLKKPFEGMKEKFLEIAGIIAAAFTFEKAIEAATEGETALNGFNSALAITGAYSEAATEHFQHYAEALEKTTSASHVAIETGASMLVTLGKLSGQGLDKATKASLDLAAALHIDTATAFNLVAKAAEGHVQSLARYGIQVKATGDAQRDFATTLKLLETRFGGLAEMQTNTFAGAMARTKNMFDNLLEAVGNMIIKSPLLMTIFKALAEAFESAAKAVERFAGSRDVLSELATVLITFGQNLTTYVVAPLEFAYNIGKIVFEGFKTLVQGAVLMIATAVSDITGVLALLSNKFKPANDAVKDFAASTEATLNAFVNDTTAAVDQVFDFNVAAKTQSFLTKAQTFVNNVKPTIKTNFQGIADAVNASAVKPTFFSSFAQGFQNATKSMIVSANQLGAAVHNTLSVGFSNAFSAMGAALVAGQDGFAAFGKAMLGVLGDLALQFGAVFITMGVGRAFSSYGLDPTATGLIIAGGALSILGGALKAIGGSASGAPTPSVPSATGGGVASGGGSGSPPTDTTPTSFNDTQRAGSGTNVVVQVQGNVFDTKQTGMHIADILSDTFGSNGVTFAGAKLS